MEYRQFNIECPNCYTYRSVFSGKYQCSKCATLFEVSKDGEIFIVKEKRAHEIVQLIVIGLQLCLFLIAPILYASDGGNFLFPCAFNVVLPFLLWPKERWSFHSTTLGMIYDFIRRGHLLGYSPYDSFRGYISIICVGISLIVAIIALIMRI